MHIISKKILKEFSALHPDAESALDHWYFVMKQGSFKDFPDLRQTFRHADLVGARTVFNIGGNKYRLIASIHFNCKRVYVLHILTHNDYDKGGWK